jgi:hypothetical protein
MAGRSPSARSRAENAGRANSNSTQRQPEAVYAAARSVTLECDGLLLTKPCRYGVEYAWTVECAQRGATIIFCCSEPTTEPAYCVYGVGYGEFDPGSRWGIDDEHR